MQRSPSADDVTRAQSGDHAAFRRLFFATADRTHRLARWLLGTEDVDDIVQDIYVRTWERLPDLDEPAAFEGWLRKVAVSVILRGRERMARHAMFEVSLEAEVPSPVERSRFPGLQIDLDRAVAKLPDGARAVFVLYDVEGYRHKEIARVLDITHHTSRSQLHRARSLLKQILKDPEAT